MATIEHQTRTRAGQCPTHGQVTAEKQVPKLKFPIVVTGVARFAATLRPYRCRECGAEVS
jgi:hypothetical protein